MKHMIMKLMVVISTLLSVQAADLPSLLREAANIAELPPRVESLQLSIDGIKADLANRDTASREELNALVARITALETKPDQAPPGQDKFSFVLQNDVDGFADDSWDEIVKSGQTLQAAYWQKYETYYKAIYGDIRGPGWHGTAHMPVILIIAVEPEYRFRKTHYLPGRFQVTSPSRWGSILKWEAATVLDTINWGTATKAPIGLIVRAAHTVHGCIMRPFEQGIERVTLQTINGVLPVYLELNCDRFRMTEVKVLQRGGAMLGIKHGPRLDGVPSSESVWLTDCRFSGLQMEGPATNTVPQAAMLLCGANIVISDLNLYYWRQGPYLHADTGAVINGLTMHSSGYAPEDLRPYIVSRQTGSAQFSAISCVQEGLYPPKGSWNTLPGGWYNKPGPIL